MHIHCFGCGACNQQGLQLKSRWLEPGVRSECQFQPQPWHCAGPTTCVNGGIMATIIDCHAICTAMAASYLAEGRELSSLPAIHYATARLDVSYVRPAAIDQPLRAMARMMAMGDKKAELAVELSSGAHLCATATVLAVRVPENWSP